MSEQQATETEETKDLAVTEAGGAPALSDWEEKLRVMAQEESEKVAVASSVISTKNKIFSLGGTPLGDTIDVRRFVAHHAAVVGADVEPADVVAPDHQDIGLLLAGIAASRNRLAGNRLVLLLESIVQQEGDRCRTGKQDHVSQIMTRLGSTSQKP